MTAMQHTAQDRCDRCPAQGFTTWGRDALRLTFCNHHSNRYAEELVEQGFRLMVDDTMALHSE